MRKEVETVVCGQRLTLLPERGIYWSDAETLLVADVHLGKAASFRAQGVPIPAGSTAGTLERLSDLLTRTKARRLIVLGDLWHARSGRTAETMAQFSTWRSTHEAVEMILVEGNHDLRSGKLPHEWRTCEVSEPFEVGPFAMCHYPETSTEASYRMAGHLHPGVLLEGRGKQSLRLPCFLFSQGGAILPAFGEFTGLALIDPEPRDRVFVLADQSVIRVA